MLLGLLLCLHTGEESDSKSGFYMHHQLHPGKSSSSFVFHFCFKSFPIVVNISLLFVLPLGSIRKTILCLLVEISTACVARSVSQSISCHNRNSTDHPSGFHSLGEFVSVVEHCVCQYLAASKTSTQRDRSHRLVSRTGRLMQQLVKKMSILPDATKRNC